MSLLDFFSKPKKTETRLPSAGLAKDRLKLILINERGLGGISPEYLPRLQKELIEVVSRYVQIDSKDIQINMDKHDSLEVLEVKVELPSA